MAPRTRLLAAASGAGKAAVVRPFTVTCDIDPRFRDTDGFGHINNAVYISYMEVARQVYWRRLRPDQRYEAVPFIMAHITCDIRSEALVGEMLEVGIQCAWIGTKSFAFVYEVCVKATRRVVLEAQTVQVCYDYDTKKSIAMPADLRRDVERLEGRPMERPD